MKNDKLLTAENIHASYGKKQVLFGVSLIVETGEIISLIGPNGSGKSTFLKVIIGLLSPRDGKINFADEDITNYSIEKRVKLGIGYFLQGGEVFPNLSVHENLRIGAFGLRTDEYKALAGEIFQLFPILNKYKERRAGLLSGGERQALALGIVLMKKPKLLLLDEPSAGLSPVLVTEMIKKIKATNETFGVTILLVEQNVREALKIASMVYLLKKGQIIGRESPTEVLKKGRLDDVFFR